MSRAPFLTLVQSPFTARLTISLCAIAMSFALAAPAFAQGEERQLGWKNSTELGLVLTTGNSNTTNFNVRNLFAYDWQQADLDWEFGILRASSDDDRFAVGTEDNYEIIRPNREPDNNRIYTNLRYLRNINPRFFWYARLETVKDSPADIDYRFTPAGGAGNKWANSESLRFLTGYGVSYTTEKLSLDGQRDFAGYQLFYDFAMQATTTTRVESKMVFDGSFEEGDDVRFDWFNGVGVSISESIALKTGLRLNYRNLPALEEIHLENPEGITIGSVVVPKKKLDAAFTTSLVINF